MSDQTPSPFRNQIAEIIRQRDHAERALKVVQERLNDFVTATAELAIERLRLQRRSMTSYLHLAT